MITKQEIDRKKQLALSARELSNITTNMLNNLPKRLKIQQKGPLNYNSPNVRERLGWCKPIN